MNRRGLIALTAVTFLAAAFAACGGGGSVPNGPVHGYTAPSPGASDAPATASFSITVPNAQSAQQSRGRHPYYVSSGTGSVTVALAAINGVAVANPVATTIETTPGAPGCASTANGRVCTANVPAAVGDDAFTINTYSGANAGGSLLSGGTIVATIGSNGGNVNVSNSVSLTLNPVLAGLSIAVGVPGFTVGTAASANITLQATDATGAIIVGNVALPGAIALSLSGAGAGFTLSASSVTQLNQPVMLSYDGDNNVGSSITVEAALSNSTLSATTTLPVTRPPTPSPSPRPSGAPTPVPEIYVLNQGSNGGLGATVTTYDLTATANAAPRNILQLNPNLTAESIFVDGSGTLYVGYQEGEIDEFPIGATGQASPSTSITGPDPLQQTVPAPAVMTLDPSGDLVTLGVTNLNGNQGALAAIVYAPGASGAATPINAWNFNTPYINSNGFVAGLATDSAGNFYVDGALANSSFTTVGGIYVAPHTANNPFVNESRTIPGSSTTTIPAQIPAQGSIGGLALDQNGRIYESQYTGTGNVQSGAVNVFAAGANGGTTNVPPVQTLTGAALNVDITSLPTLPIALYNGQLFVANGSANSVLVYPASASGNQSPAQTLSGSATQLAGPLAIAVGLEIPPVNGPARVRTAPHIRRPAALAAGMRH